MAALRVGFGTPGSAAWEVDCDADDAVGSPRRELNDDINSIDCGDSPKRLLKCSAASCFERVNA